MEFITEEDLYLISKSAKTEVSDEVFEELKKVYEKLNFLCLKLKEKGYEFSIRRDPRKQAGPGKFEFQEYQWARIFPPGFRHLCDNKFSYVIGLSDSLHFHMMGLKEYQHLPPSQNASQRCWTEIDIYSSNYDSVVNDFIQFDQKFGPLLIDTAIALGITEMQKIKNEQEMKDVIDLLKMKKQIILQGPPGTGKTKLAKEIASKLTRPGQITISDVRNTIKPKLTVYSIADNIPYKVVEVDNTGISLQLKNGSNQRRNYTHIIDAYANLIKQQPLQGGDAYQAAIAKYMIDYFNNTLYRVVQFHPSYSYEDFVRGIIAIPNGNQVEYKNVNKILGQFAKDALENYELSQNNNTGIRQTNWVNNSFNEFKEGIESGIGENQFPLTDTISIFQADNQCFKYGEEWGQPGRINFTDFRTLIRAVLSGSLNINESNIPIELSKHAHYRYPYYMSLLRKFFEQYDYAPQNEVQALKNYVLIIDEINRANLSAVLGELIYALEYRGEKVESMYAIDEKNELILPLNLYIIGTMNTADRNVGHIDYAIRRRFAFVDVLPKDLTSELGTKFHKELFERVASLFGTNLSGEFEKKSVQLGHSYFIDKSGNGGSMDLQLEYEIKPILLEYVKDGILVGDVAGTSISNYILSLSV